MLKIFYIFIVTIFYAAVNVQLEATTLNPEIKDTFANSEKVVHKKKRAHKKKKLKKKRKAKKYKKKDHKVKKHKKKKRRTKKHKSKKKSRLKKQTKQTVLPASTPAAPIPVASTVPDRPRIISTNLEDIVSRIGRFSSYRGLDSNPIHGHTRQGFLAKTMLRGIEAVNPDSGPITTLRTPLNNQPNNEIVTIQANTPDLSNAYGDGTVTISKGKLKELAATAKLVFHEYGIPKEFYRYLKTLQQANSFNIMPQENRTLRQILQAGAINIDNDIVAQYSTLGFQDVDHLNTILNTHALILGSNIAHSQKVHFFVEQHVGTNGNAYNKLKNTNLDNETPVVLISIPGLNFAYGGSASTLRTMWGGTNNERQKIRGHLKRMWTLVLESAKQQGVNNITSPGIGLGAFLSGTTEQKNQIAKAYFETLAEVLSLPAYQNQFENIFYNPTPPYQTVFNEVLNVNPDTPLRYFGGDVKFLAIELAKARKNVALVNPSDADVVWGLYDVGEYWKNGHYVGEEDMGATSTAVLGSAGINDVYTNPARMFQITD